MARAPRPTNIQGPALAGIHRDESDAAERMRRMRRRRRLEMSGDTPADEPFAIEGPPDDTPEEPASAPIPPPLRPPGGENVLVDREIERALAAGEPANLTRAFPQPPGLMSPSPGSRQPGARMVSTEYQYEYRLKLMHRMLMRNLPMDLIAQSLEVHINTAYALRRELVNRLRQEASKMDLEGYVGQVLAYYNEIGGLAMRIAGRDQSPEGVRIKAMYAAMQTRRDIITFLDKVGFHDALKLTPKQSVGDTQTDQAVSLVDMAKDVLTGEFTLRQRRSAEEAMNPGSEEEAAAQVTQDDASITGF